MNPSSVAKAICPIDLSPEVHKFIALRESADSLKERLVFLEQSMKEIEICLIGHVDSGEDLLHCEFELSVRNAERRYPAWKEHFISRLGKIEADEVLAATSPPIHRKIIIK